MQHDESTRKHPWLSSSRSRHSVSLLHFLRAAAVSRRRLQKKKKESHQAWNEFMTAVKTKSIWTKEKSAVHQSARLSQWNSLLSLTMWCRQGNVISHSSFTELHFTERKGRRDGSDSGLLSHELLQHVCILVACSYTGPEVISCYATTSRVRGRAVLDAWVWVNVPYGFLLDEETQRDRVK